MTIESRSAPGREHRAGDEREHDGEAAEPVQLARPDHAEPGEDDDDERQLEGDPQRQHHLEHEAEVGVVGDERRDRLGLEAEQHAERLGHDEDVGQRRAGQKEEQPDEERRAPAPSSPAAYSAGATKAQICQRMTGEASTSPTTKPSLSTIMTGSVGLVHDQLAVGEIGRDRVLEQGDQLEALDQPEPQRERPRQGAERPEDAGAQFLEVIEERHLPGRSRS